MNWKFRLVKAKYSLVDDDFDSEADFEQEMMSIAADLTRQRNEYEISKKSTIKGNPVKKCTFSICSK